MTTHELNHSKLKFKLIESLQCDFGARGCSAKLIVENHWNDIYRIGRKHAFDELYSNLLGFVGGYTSELWFSN